MVKNFKFFIVFIGCLALRLIPFRAPNLEPIMASVMPVSKKYGAILGFLFGFLSIIFYDMLTNFGTWTIITAITYGAVGAVSALYFQKYKSNISNFVAFSVFATLFYDLITGVLVAPFLGQNIMTAFILQIPFTALHLAGNIGLALTLSPILNKFLTKEISFSFWRRRIAV